MQEDWQEVISHLDNVPSDVKINVRNLFLTIDSLGSGTEFVNVYLVKLIQKYDLDSDSNNIEEIVSFFKEVESLAYSLKPALDKAFELQQFVLEETAHLSDWSDPVYVQRNSLRFQTRLMDMGLQLGESGLIGFFSDSPREGRLILIQAIRNVVDCYDKIIKSCTSSRDFASYKEKASAFLDLLKSFRELMMVVRELNSARYKKTSTSYFLPDSLETISEVGAKLLMDVSSGFDISELLQEDIEYVTKEPLPAESLEEKFTFYHQMLIKDLASLSIKMGLTVSLLPDELSSFLNSINTEYYDEKISSMNIEGNLITINIDFPLRQHGAALILQYDRVKKSIGMTMSLYGRNELDRWNYINELADFLSTRLSFGIKNSIIKDTSLSIEFLSVTLDETAADRAFKIIKALIGASFVISGESGRHELFEIIPEEFQTEDLALLAIEKDFRSLKNMPEIFKTNKKVIAAALAISPGALNYVPFQAQTFEMALEVVKKNRSCIAFVAPQFKLEVLSQVALPAPSTEQKPKKKSMVSDDW